MTADLRKQPALRRRVNLKRLRALCIIIRRVVDPRANRVRSHQPRIAGLQQIGDRFNVRHSRIEPQVLVVWVKDDGHSVVDGGCHGIRRRGKNRT